jgi:hypothetical protein
MRTVQDFNAQLRQYKRSILGARGAWRQSQIQAQRSPRRPSVSLCPFFLHARLYCAVSFHIFLHKSPSIAMCTNYTGHTTFARPACSQGKCICKACRFISRFSPSTNLLTQNSTPTPRQPHGPVCLSSIVTAADIARPWPRSTVRWHCVVVTCVSVVCAPSLPFGTKPKRLSAYLPHPPNAQITGHSTTITTKTKHHESV